MRRIDRFTNRINQKNLIIRKYFIIIIGCLNEKKQALHSFRNETITRIHEVNDYRFTQVVIIRFKMTSVKFC